MCNASYACALRVCTLLTFQFLATPGPAAQLRLRAFPHVWRLMRGESKGPGASLGGHASMPNRSTHHIMTCTHMYVRRFGRWAGRRAAAL